MQGEMDTNTRRIHVGGWGGGGRLQLFYMHFEPRVSHRVPDGGHLSLLVHQHRASLNLVSRLGSPVGLDEQSTRGAKREHVERNLRAKP